MVATFEGRAAMSLRTRPSRFPSELVDLVTSQITVATNASLQKSSFNYERSHQQRHTQECDAE